jgi:hypothetical protein
MRAPPGNVAVNAIAIAAALVCALLGLAFAIAPRACTGGLELYAWAGVGVLAVLLTLPFVLRVGGSALARAVWTVGLLAAGAAAWLGGIGLADVRIMCRLF